MEFTCPCCGVSVELALILPSPDKPYKKTPEEPSGVFVGHVAELQTAAVVEAPAAPAPFASFLPPDPSPAPAPAEPEPFPVDPESLKCQDCAHVNNFVPGFNECSTCVKRGLGGTKLNYQLKDCPKPDGALHAGCGGCKHEDRKFAEPPCNDCIRENALRARWEPAK